MPSLLDRLPPPELATGDLLLERFLEHTEALSLTLYPAQEEAILELLAGNNVILATPTGSGKSLVATALHFKALAEGKVSFYTSPIKALVNEKFFALCRDFGADQVGLMTGDATVNRDAPIVCCTAEILANLALRQGDRADVDYAVLDEFHYYADKDRGMAWQVPLLELPQARFLLMSATLGVTTFFEERLTALNGSPTVTVRSSTRPVPLEFSYAERPLHETAQQLVEQDRAPVYLVNFSQRAAAEQAQNLMSVDFCTKEQKQAIKLALRGARFDSPYGKEIRRFLEHGIGIHHAGLLPKYRLIVERLAQTGLLKIISGTDTLGVGVNIPIRTVLFTQLCKYDGSSTKLLSVRDFQQIAGRAGRKGFDDIGYVVAQAPAHEIENKRLDARAGDDAKKRRKIVRRPPPERGYKAWDARTFDRLITSPPEELVSRFAVSHAVVLNTLMRPGGSCRPLRQLIAGSHESVVMKRRHRRAAWELFKSLLESEIVSIEDAPEGGRRIVLGEDLQDSFSLNQTLSLFLVHALDLFDPESETHALDVVSLAESILEDPWHVLAQQVEKLKTEKLAELKAAGVEYEERMAELEKIEHPKPLADVLYGAYDGFAGHYPWAKQQPIRPKSIARDMFEQFASFAEYVKTYGLQRSEGVLLRYLSDCYRVLTQNVPERRRTEALDDVIAYVREVLRTVDSSLLDEWERMRDPARLEAMARAAERGEDVREAEAQATTRASDITARPEDFERMVRTGAFHVVRALSRHDFEEALDVVAAAGTDDQAWTPQRLEEALRPYFAEYTVLRIDNEARNKRHGRILERQPDRWVFEQAMLDAEDVTDWVLRFIVDVAASRREQRVVLQIESLRALG